MLFGNRILLRGLRSYIPDGTAVLAISPGVSDALGTHRRTTAVLTDESLLLATSVRARTVLTVIPRSDMRSVDQTDPGVIRIAFDDYVHAIRRVVVLDLSQRGDQQGLIPQLLDGAVGA